MPQLDPSSYPSQIFWLIVCFLILYTVMLKVALPRITEVLQNRQEKIANDLDTAEELRLEAEQLEEEYKIAVESGQQKANDLIAQAVSEVNEESKKMHEELDQELAKQFAKAEKRLEKSRVKATNELSKASAQLSVLIVEKIADIKVDSKTTGKVIKNLLKSA